MDFNTASWMRTLFLEKLFPDGVHLHVYTKQEVEQALNIAWESVDKWWLIDTFDHISPNKWNYETDFSCL